MKSNGSAGSGGLRRSVANVRTEIKLLEDGKSNMQVLGLNSVRVGSPAEVEMLLEKGSKVRATDAMHQNDQSSRSHAVLTLQLHYLDDQRTLLQVRTAALRMQ